jgi:hypothetical protein
MLPTVLFSVFSVSLCLRVSNSYCFVNHPETRWIRFGGSTPVG